VLWAAACVLVVLRAVLTFVPTMHVWSLNQQRFLAPLTAWLPWALAAAALVPPLAKRIAPWLARLGDWIADARARATLACMAAAAGLVWLLPDRVRFVGDFLLRQGTVEEAEKPSIIFPQALPLDVLLHYRLPLAITGWGLADANGGARLVGSLEAALLAWLALACARVLGRRGASGAATAAIVFFGGALGMFTGYSKAFSELMLLTAVVAVSGLAVLRDPARATAVRGLLPLGLAVATGAVLHRSALSLVPAMGLVWWRWLRMHAREDAWKRPAVVAAFAAPLVTLAIMTPRIVADVLRWDAVHFNPAEVQAGGGPLRAAFANGRPLDLLNLLLMLSPLAIAVPAVAWLLGRAHPRRGEFLFLAVLALPMVLAAPLIHPSQGLFRDWDDFAATGVAISLVVAWLAGEALRAAPRHAWVGVALALGVAAPAVQGLALQADAERAFARVGAFLSEPPRRTPAERAKTWDYVGIVEYRREHWSDASAAFARSAETGPSYRVMLQWAMATTNGGDLRGAADIYRRMLARYPDAPYAWLGLGAVTSRLADAAPPGEVRAAHVAESRRAARELLKLEPGNREARALLAYLERRFGAE
jgi:tetratricopeptide (TPR) repeat protein